MSPFFIMGCESKRAVESKEQSSGCLDVRPPNKTDTKRTISVRKTHADVVFEFRKANILEPIGPTVLPRDVSHKTRVAEHDEINMTKNPAGPKIEFVEEVPIHNVFSVQKNHSIANL